MKYFEWRCLASTLRVSKLYIIVYLRFISVILCQEKCACVCVCVCMLQLSQSNTSRYIVARSNVERYNLMKMAQTLLV